MMTETTLVLAVVSMIVADSSRITPMKMKHQVATTLGAQQRRGDLPQRLQPGRAEDAARLLELGMEAAERRLELLVAGRQLDRQKGEQQDPQRAVEHERRPRVG